MFFTENRVIPTELSVSGNVLFRKTTKSIIKMQHLEGIYKTVVMYHFCFFFLVWCFVDFFRFDAGYPCDRGPVLHIYKREGARSPAQGEPEEPPGIDQPAAAELHETALAR